MNPNALKELLAAKKVLQTSKDLLSEAMDKEQNNKKMEKLEVSFWRVTNALDVLNRVELGDIEYSTGAVTS